MSSSSCLGIGKTVSFKIDGDGRNGHGYAEKNDQIGNDISCLDDDSNSSYDADGRSCWASTAAADTQDACYFATLPVLHFIQFFIC